MLICACARLYSDEQKLFILGTLCQHICLQIVSVDCLSKISTGFGFVFNK